MKVKHHINFSLIPPFDCPKMSSAKSSKTTRNALATTALPPSLSAEAIAENEDLRNEILHRLPIKSLMRFKSVSKLWLSHITSPNFSRSRAALQNGSIPGLIMKRPSKYTTTKLRGVPEYDYFNLGGGENSADSSGAPFNRRITFTKGRKSRIGILASSHGLLLCTKVCKQSVYHTPEKPRECYIYNPATKQHKVLPRTVMPSYTNVGFSLAFDPSKSPYYKVVCISNNDVINGNRHRVEIYSSETRRWRLLLWSSFHSEQSRIRFDAGVYWNGAIHWISSKGAIFYFKLDDEQMRELRLAPIFRDNTGTPCACRSRRYRYFGESRGHLHLVDHIEVGDSPCFYVYEMAEDYSRWFVKFRVDLTVLRQFTGRSAFGAGNLDDFVFYVLSVVRCEPEEDSYMVLQVPGVGVRYNFKTKAIDKIYDVGEHGVDPSWIKMLTLFPDIGVWPDEAHQYVETLAAV